MQAVVTHPARRLLPATGALRLPARRPLAARPQLPARRAAPACSAAQRGAVELLLDKVPGEREVLSAKLNPDVRQRTERGAPGLGVSGVGVAAALCRACAHPFPAWPA